MARRRMFSIDVVETDAFLDLPIMTQNLFFHLALNADDDGFIANTRRVKTLIGASDDDLSALKEAGYLISFDSGLLVITHWHVMNQIRADRYKATVYQNEMQSLRRSQNGEYVLIDGP